MNLLAMKRDLAAVNKNKKDELFIQLSDIEREMQYYRKQFIGKTVFLQL